MTQIAGFLYRDQHLSTKDRKNPSFHCISAIHTVPVYHMMQTAIEVLHTSKPCGRGS